jgi:ACS family glucarate transporter-like MFS transporter
MLPRPGTERRPGKKFFKAEKYGAYLLKVRGLDLKASAFYSTIPPIAMVTCSLLGGAVSDALTKSHGSGWVGAVVGVFSLLLAGFFLVLGSHAENARLASVVLSGGAGAQPPDS